MICDKAVTTKVIGKVYKTVVRPAMLFSLDGGTNQKIGGKGWDGIVKDIVILFGSDEDRVKNEGTFWRHSYRGQISIVWTYGEEGWWTY